MDRKTAMWTLVAFFGASVAFNLIFQATEDEGRGTTFVWQLVGLVAIVLFIVWIVRRQSGPGDQ